MALTAIIGATAIPALAPAFIEEAAAFWLSITTGARRS
jgi:hypothetical protein